MTPLCVSNVVGDLLGMGTGNWELGTGGIGEQVRARMYASRFSLKFAVIGLSRTDTWECNPESDLKPYILYSITFVCEVYGKKPGKLEEDPYVLYVVAGLSC